MKHSITLKNIVFIISITCLVSLIGCSKKVVYNAPSALSKEYISELSNEKKIAYRFTTSAKENYLIFDSILSPKFYSLDQSWKGDKKTFIQKRNSDSSFSKMKPVRIIQDDSLVAVHSRVLGDTLRFRWDILRFKEQKVQEHWSNVNDSIGLNPNKHSEIDGPTIPTQLEKTDVNRSLINKFIKENMIRKEGGAMKFFSFKKYIQHNRDVGDGLSGLLWAMIKMSFQGNTITFKHNYHVIAEGNFVLSATEGYVGKEKTTFFDFFRIENNKIIEHWDIIAPINEFLYFQPVEKIKNE
ncbi:hypothetical protein H9I45_13315 [Polaribacter haliotis]|uniref:SnoaL-like domain-containing protein n=1 Tax=Polaribacter haliotis TaxID=1888915 RepID=A0A7L8AE96_9FLAO|nr:hypothetical protein [Polaribacter haliotis]QOD60311.1 hypothetical protein H9I45_13315 [Polaribacter haliotis]